MDGSGAWGAFNTSRTDLEMAISSSSGSQVQIQIWVLWKSSSRNPSLASFLKRSTTALSNTNCPLAAANWPRSSAFFQQTGIFTTLKTILCRRPPLTRCLFNLPKTKVMRTTLGKCHPWPAMSPPLAIGGESPDSCRIKTHKRPESEILDNGIPCQRGNYEHLLGLVPTLLNLLSVCLQKLPSLGCECRGFLFLFLKLLDPSSNRWSGREKVLCHWSLENGEIYFTIPSL